MSNESSGTPESGPTALLYVLASVVLVVVTSATMVGVALPSVGQDFGVSEGTYGWLITGYLLTFGVFSAIWGRLGDVLGARRLYLAGVASSGLCALFVAVAPWIELAILLRIVQGACAAAIPSMGTMIITRLFPPHRRGSSMSVVLASVGVGASLGPVIGGVLVQFFSWRAVFAAPAVALLALPVAWRQLPSSLDVRTDQRFDGLGAFLLGSGVATMMWALDAVSRFGPGWQACLAVALGMGLLALFVWWIRRVSQPFVEPSLFMDRRYVSISMIACLVNATRFGTLILVPIFLVDVNHLEPAWIGGLLVPGALMIALMSPVAGRWMDRSGSRPTVTTGVASVIVGNLICCWFAGGNPYGVAAGLTLYGVGFGLVRGPLSAAASQVVPKHLTGVGLGIFLMIFFVGGGLGAALSVTTLELQGRDAASWIGLGQGGEHPFPMPSWCSPDSPSWLCWLLAPCLTLRVALGRHDTGPLRRSGAEDLIWDSQGCATTARSDGMWVRSVLPILA